MEKINQYVYDLVAYGVRKKLVKKQDVTYTTNRILEILNLDEYTAPSRRKETDIEKILQNLLNYCEEKGLVSDSIVEKDLLDTKLMGALTPPPSTVIAKFRSAYRKSPMAATEYFYDFSCATDYIRTYRIQKDVKWVTSTEYGDLDITINLSKPEKDPKAIAAAKLVKQSGYPKCLLCRENEGYAGRLNHPARQNHRIMPITLNDQTFFLQYSPYVYYNEHCIVFNTQHIPMKIDHAAFCKLLDFVTIFPHYFIGSNADLPIVGGSILTHDHFQGGHYTFAMERAPIQTEVSFAGLDDVKCGIVKWPMSVLRLRCKDKSRIIALSDRILDAWRAYTDADAFIYANTNGEDHNTITPIARRRGEDYEMDLVLRNNITTEEHPLGVYHPHAELHHIKKENIGLIEVMGLAVLPSRLKGELEALAQYLGKGELPQGVADLEKHLPWAKGLMEAYTFTPENAQEILQKEVGKVFATVLEHAGVYKQDHAGQEAFLRFVAHVNQL